LSIPKCELRTNQPLQERLSGLRERKAALEVTYTKEWPDVKKLQVSDRRLEQEIQTAAKETITSLRVELRSRPGARAKRSGATMRNSARSRTQQTRDRIDMTAFAHGSKPTNSISRRSTEAPRSSDRAGRQGQRSQIRNYSRVPRSPVGPRACRNVMIAFVLSLVAGIGLAFLLDFLDDTVKSLDDVDRYIHLPALAMIPASRGGRDLKGCPATSGLPKHGLAMIDDVRSPIAESYRHLRTSLLLSHAGQPPKTILVTSSQPSEGKTTTAINTGVHAGADRRRRF
jgi:hypothetical protein